MIAAVRHPNQHWQQMTKEDGGFLFTNLPAGKYVLTAQARGRQPQAYEEYEGYLTAIVTRPGVKSEGIVFALQSPGAITGTVVDQDGDPVETGSVMLLKKTVELGKQIVTQPGQQQTRLGGKFAFRNLEPGTYYVAVNARPWYAEVQQPDLDVAYPVTYYGDTDDPDAATPISVTEGTSIDIQISPHAVPGVHVPLPATGRTDEHQGFGTMMAVRGMGGVSFPVSANVMANDSGVEISGIAPGKYVLDVQRNVDGKMVDGWQESLSVSEGGASESQRSPKASVTGKVSFAAGSNAGVLSLINPEKTYQAGVEATGSFTFPNGIAPGTYQVTFGGPVSSAVITSLTAEGAKISGSTVEIPAGGAVTLTVVAGAGTEKVDGFVVKDGAPVASAMVLLLPKNAERAELIGRDQSDSDGSFTLERIVPGSYRLLAIDDGHGLAYREAAAIAPYLAKAMDVQIPLNGSGPIKIEVQKRQR